MEKLSYGFSVTRESDSSVHSIDKLIIFYYLHYSDLDSVFESLVSVLESHSDWRLSLDTNRNAYKDKSPSSHYSWFRSSFWTDGLNVKIGEFSRHGLVWWLSSIVKVEFNPNKSFMRVDIGQVLDWLRVHSYQSILRECDYAVDLPCLTSSVITSSRKDKVTYNDSRYYGKRHVNGRLKVYNKRREVLDKEKIELGFDLSRCEITCCFDSPLDFSIATVVGDCDNDVSSLSPNLRSIVGLLSQCVSYGDDPQELLHRFVPDKRNRDKLLPFVVGQSDHFVFELRIFLDLLSMYRELYGFTYMFTDAVSSKRLGASVDIVNSITHVEWS